MVNEFNQLGLNFNPNTKDFINNINPYDYIRSTGRPVRPIRYSAPGTGFQLVDTYNPTYNVVDDYALKYNAVNPNKVQLPARINSNLPVVYKNPINTGVNQDSINIIDDILYNNRNKDINNAMKGATKASRKSAVGVAKNIPAVAKGIAKDIAPFIGNIYDFAEGTSALKEGDVGRGLALYGLGAVGTLADLGSLMSLGPTAGAGTVALQAGKSGLKKAIRGAIKNKVARKALSKTAKLNDNMFTGRGARTLATIALSTSGDKNTIDNAEQGQETNNSYANANGTTQPNSEEFIKQLVDLYGIDAGENNTEETGNNSNLDINTILDLYNKQYEAQQPYLEALGNYINNYKDLQNDAMIRDRGNVALAGLSGNAGYNQLVGRYNPATIEADRINLINSMANIEAQRAGGLNELIGNIAIAEKMGLPAESAFGNKNLLTALGAYNRALYGLEGKKYVADINRDIQLALMAGRKDLALQLQQLKNLGGVERAFINSAGYGDLDSLINAMSIMGYNLNNQPTNNEQNQNTNIDWGNLENKVQNRYKQY